MLNQLFFYLGIYAINLFQNKIRRDVCEIMEGLCHNFVGFC